jgi:hypothetical protein
MGKKSGSGSGMNNTDHISESVETVFWVKILKFFDEDPWRKEFGSGINILDPQHWLKMCQPKKGGKKLGCLTHLRGRTGRSGGGSTFSEKRGME